MKFIRAKKSLTKRDVLQRLSMLPWHVIHERKRTPLFTSLLFEGTSKHYDRGLRFPYEVENIAYLDSVIPIADGEWQKLRRQVLRQQQRQPNFLFNVLQRSYRLNAEIEAWCRSVRKKKLKSGDTALLQRHWDWYLHKTYIFGAVILLPLFIEEDMESQLRSVLKRSLDDAAAAEAFRILTTPQQKGIVQKEERYLLQLAAQYQKVSAVPRRAINAYKETFGWITNTSFDGTFITEQQFQKRFLHIANLAPKKKLIAQQQQDRIMRRQFLSVYANFRGNQQARHYIETLQESMYYRGWRTERYYHNAYFLQEFFSATAEALGLSKPEYVFYLVPEEIISGLCGRSMPPESVLQERKSGYMVLADDQHEFIASGPFLAQAKAAYAKHPQQKSAEMKGQVAYSGVVQGRVCVVTGKGDFKKVRNGDVLVTGSTTPDYVPLLHRVCAILAEEGGVLSHASVISRELHIPCIIGTKNVTKVLKDGDMVKVDAEKGIVRKL